ncbi:unnamed protein product, partial [Amoebophrya sp. A25]
YLKTRYSCSLRFDLADTSMEKVAQVAKSLSSSKKEGAAPRRGSNPFEVQQASGDASSTNALAIAPIASDKDGNVDLLDLQKTLHENAFLPLFRETWIADLNRRKMRMKGSIVFNLELDRRSDTLALVAVAKNKTALERIAGQLEETLLRHSGGLEWIKSEAQFPTAPTIARPQPLPGPLGGSMTKSGNRGGEYGGSGGGQGGTRRGGQQLLAGEG